ncbi:MAG: hypothetical protein ABIO19_01620 [Burkholderiaceae bacterium]
MIFPLDAMDVKQLSGKMVRRNKLYFTRKCGAVKRKNRHFVGAGLVVVSAAMPLWTLSKNFVHYQYHLFVAAPQSKYW